MMMENGYVTSEAMQMIRMCVETFFNLYGYMPSTQDMIDWLGDTYEQAVPIYMGKMAAA